jgi:hypothetical protein
VSTSSTGIRRKVIPLSGSSEGIGSLQTETIWEILRSDNERGDLAAWILDEEIEIRVWQSGTLAYLLSKVQLAFDDCVDVLPAHVVCLAD